MKQPFRFYGARPADWFDGLVYEVRFDEAPDAATRVALAEAIEAAAHEAAVTLHHGPWRWSGKHLRIDAYANDEAAAFEAMQEVLLAAHDVAPIAQVVALHARARGRGGWDRASVKAQREPDPGPPYDPPLTLAGVAYPRATDPTFPVAREDEAVEAARWRARQALDAAADAEAMDEAGDGTRRFPAARVEAACAARTVDAATRARFDGDGDQPVWHPDRAAAVILAGGYPRGVAYLDDDGVRREVTGLPARDGAWPANLHGPWIERGGDVLWIAIGPMLYRVDVADGEAKPVFQANGRIDGIAFLGDRWVMKRPHAVALIDPATWTELDRQASKLQWFAEVLDGRAVIACDIFSTKRLEVWTVAGDQLVLATAYDLPLHAPVDVDGEVVCRVGTGDEHVALVGLAAIVERARAG